MNQLNNCMCNSTQKFINCTHLVSQLGYWVILINVFCLKNSVVNVAFCTEFLLVIRFRNLFIPFIRLMMSNMIWANLKKITFWRLKNRNVFFFFLIGRLFWPMVLDFWCLRNIKKLVNQKKSMSFFFQNEIFP